MAKRDSHKILKIDDVKQLGVALLKVADLYPTQFLTERDFFPLVYTYLVGRFPGVEKEVQTGFGRIDFQLKGTNPTWLELAVQPRELRDKNHEELAFPGAQAANALYASQNFSELKKLMREPTGKTRFLLLVDLTGTYDHTALKKLYQEKAKRMFSKGRPRKHKKIKPVNVVLAQKDKDQGHKKVAFKFQVRL